MQLIKKKDMLREDRAYRRVKKTEPPVFGVPPWLVRAAGICQMGLDGIACGSKEAGYSVVYQVHGPVSDSSGFIRMLREKDFCVEAYRKKPGDTDFVLALYSQADGMEDARRRLAGMEGELAGILESLRASMERMDFQARMRYVHECLSFGFQKKRKEVKDYLQDTVSWAGDFDTDAQYAGADGIPPGFAQRDGVWYRACFIRRFSSHTDSPAEILRQHGNIRYIKSCLQPVSDRSAAIRYGQTFLDADVTKNRLARKKEGLFRVLAARPGTVEDTRHFCLGSMMFLLRGISADGLRKEYGQLENELLACGYRLDHYYGAMPQAVRALAAGSFPEMNPLRLQESSRMGYFII